MQDRLLTALLRSDHRPTCRCIACLAAARIETLKTELNRANRSLGLYMHHSARKKVKR